MENDRFDTLTARLAQELTRRRSLGLLTALGAAAGVTTKVEAGKHKKKKKKKTCAKKCPGGCCTSKTGACIQPAQQSLGLCGTGGEICRSTGCGGTCPNCGCSASKPCPSGQCCDGKGTCGACRVFVSSTKHAGDMGGLVGADAICQNLATAAGLPGTYLAWLSDSTGASPDTRFTKATEPYTLVDGTVIARNWSDLIDGSLNQAINRSQTGALISGNDEYVWTNTSTAGAARAGGTTYCEDWHSSAMSVRGAAGRLTADTTWTTGTNLEPLCFLEERLYCFQQR